MQLFGTDGIRAPFGTYPLDETTVTHLGYRLAKLLAEDSENPRVVLGGDTRESTPHLCRWLAAGLGHGGALAVFGGVLPTPAIARAVIAFGADAGISVSASHNLHPYNGIKIFDREGFKWSEDAEEILERQMVDTRAPDIAGETELTLDLAIAETYTRLLSDQAGSSAPFAGMKIVLDTANGAATPFAEPLFASLGAEVLAIGNQPDGQNINRGCGSTAPEPMLAAVKESGAHIGIAFDGDADRALIADEQGQMRDGDAMMFAWARFLQEQNSLSPATIVATSMSNLGLEKALADLDISVLRCDVGDRTVVATMRDKKIRLGGEQSGHLVDLDVSTTGDGLSTALQMVSILQQQQAPLSDLLASFRRFPQVLRNVEVESKPPFESLPEITRIAAGVEEELGSQGRLVLRYSGTEPLARVMIEGQEMKQIDRLATLLVDAIQDAIGIESH